ncbi:SdpI family protein [Nocardiopsis sp. Huas11]|uniref:SdpI family protein n=1 Tax=Nocardiopsis sp. Huas11 TaxID=2183912 RepID=UPI001315239A|nr:SdpI family protein [Nocardiopsis sp. Huas11]
MSTSLVVFATAALLLAAAHAGARGKLPPNPYLGIRTTLTADSDEAWYEVHRRAAPWWVVAGIATAIGGFALFLIEDGGFQMGALLVAAAVCLATVIAGALTSSRAVRDRLARRDRASGEHSSG